MRLTLSLLLCLFVSFLAKGQAPVAAFTADLVSGCSPLTVSFTDQSTGSPISWNWDFGGQLSNAQNPRFSFYPGTYTITLTVRNSFGINSVTKSNYIVANPSPTASFVADKTISCLPGNIQFTDLSVPNAGNIIKWEWDLGDGTKDASQNPKHTYTAAGYYNIYLKVTSTTGCSSATSAARYIRMVNGVKADFNTTGPATCKPPYNIFYNNLTSGPGNITYNWDLGNGNTSTLPSPTGNYTTAGSYTVKLTAQSDFGCSDAIQKTIPINGITTSFTVNNDSICLGSPVSFQSTSSPAPVKVLWDFGDGTSSGQLSPPPKIYASPGTYPVTLYGTFTSCTDSAKKNIIVFGKPAVDFYSADNNSSCKAPAPVTFQNNSPDVVSAHWDFGDGNSGNSVGTSSIVHTYNALGNFTVTLTITDSRGCQNTISKTNYVNILGPVVSIGGVPPGLCVGQNFAPNFTGGTVDGIASYLWHFGDGTTSTAANPTHSYAVTGNYQVTLDITTNGGCSASGSASNTIKVGQPPLVDFDKDLVSICHSSTVVFTNLSIPPGDSVRWSFGDGTSSIVQNPSHKFPDSGFYSITLKVSSNGCSNSLTKTDFVHVLPPVANFGYTVPDCTNRSGVNFIDSSVNDPVYGPLSYQWSFGDPAATVVTTAPPAPITFTYPPVSSYITYNVQLIVANSQCVDTIVKPVKLYNENADFLLAKPVFCRNETVQLSSTNNTSYVSLFDWVVDGDSAITNQAEHGVSFAVTGSHSAQLVTTDVNGCTSTSPQKPFTVTGPTARFKTISKGGCSNSTIVFTDSSFSSGTLTKWVFDFGDGTAPKTYTAPPFTHTYTNTGAYAVTLTTYDNTSNNCSDVYTDSVFITKPVTQFNAAATTFCPGTPLQFTDSSSGNGLSYAWFFGDGGTDTARNPVHNYAGRDSSYSVKLVVTDTVGCVDSLTRNNYINIKTPKPFYGVQDTATLCPPLETKFTYKGKDAESFSWDFGDGGTSTLANTSHFYNNFGKYAAKLYVTGYGGCIDSATFNITLTDPIAATAVSFIPDPAQACNNLTVNFTITPPYSARFTFYFGDGGADSSQQTSIQHLYNFPSNYFPYVFLQDSVGCQAVKGGLGSINILGAVPLFGTDKDRFCDSGSVYFTDYSQDGNDKIVTRTWDFGDGSAPVTLPKDAFHDFKTPGLYVPSLLVTTVAGCNQTFTDTVRVLATPQPSIGSADGVCHDLSLDFAGSLLVPPDTAITWKWDLGEGKNSSQQNLTVKYADTGLHHITLQATNSLGCKGDTSKNITVYPLPVITINGDTTTISGGLGLTMPLTYSKNATTFAWTPPDNLSCIDCANPFANPRFTTSYHVKVTDANGCINNRDITLVVVCNNKNFFIPNTFSPNNDGTNDQFFPRGTGLNLIQSLRIFNRWGELVFEKRNFEANDATAGWDGSFKGKPASTDTYIYMINIICENASIITYKGNVTLIR
ncbi:MAG: PKD domain-containing protein [Bacteroidota bacterium]